MIQYADRLEESPGYDDLNCQDHASCGHRRLQARFILDLMMKCRSTRQLLLTLTAALSLTMSASAKLDWTLDECEQNYGAPVGKPKPDGDRLEYRFFLPDFELRASFRDGKVCRVVYGRNAGFNPAEVQVLLKLNVPPEIAWTAPWMEKGGTSYQGYTFDLILYYAWLSADRRFLAIWTLKENYVREWESRPH
jgi:hypothetical protein